MWEIELDRLGRLLLANDLRAAYREVESLVDALRAERFDLALNYSSSRMSAVLMRLIGVADTRGWTMSADEFRRVTGRRLGWNKVLSQTFTIQRRGEQVVFSGKGFGSQVGLCLAGALAQAQAGRRYEEILRFYYPRAEIRLRRRNE